MSRIRIRKAKPCLLLVIALSVCLSILSQTTPHFEAREHESRYHGPGRDDPLPALPSEVRIGFFGPTDPSDLDSDQIWLAAQLAVETANAEGGYNGSPFRLVPIWSENPWGSGISELARSIYKDHLWAIIGSIDGPSTHLVEQLVAKSRLTLINPASSDKTVNLANVPWMFSCLPGEHLQVPILSEAIGKAAGSRPLTLVSGTDHDSRVFAKELRNQLSLDRITVHHHFDLDGDKDLIHVVAHQIISSRSAVAVIVTDASSCADLVKTLREQQFRGQIFGGPFMAQTVFLRKTGPAGTGVIFPALVSMEAVEPFSERFLSRHGKRPDYRALQTYDATSLLVKAVRKAGLNRARIRDAVREISPWQGISGPIIWDSLGQNTRSVRLATIADMQIVELERR
jgi:branched-chain amino acid transport system substrate-binding protein